MAITDTKKQIDPVCGMTVNTENAKFKTTHNNKEYFFCSQQCLDSFKNDPDDFI